MDYYNTFLTVNKHPKRVYKESFQSLVDDLFEYSSTFQDDVYEEQTFGKMDFCRKKVRINTIIDAKTGQRVNDDYKKVIFPDIDYAPPLGTRFLFDNNIWIAFSTDNIKTETSSVYVRRCNNTINTQDQYGNIHKEPCYIDYKLTETQLWKDYTLDVPSGRIYVTCQMNEYTENISINTRIVFGHSTYRVRQLSDYDRSDTFDESSVHLLSFYADYDNIAEDDNLELSVANYKCFDYSIETVDSIKNIIGYKDVLKYKVILNGEPIDGNVIWSTDNPEIATINNLGEFELLQNGECNFIGKFEFNESVSVSVPVFVQDHEEIEYKDILTPNIYYISLNDVQKYSVYEYKNQIREDTKFDIQCFDVPTSNYIFESDGNNFAIKNLKTSDSLLKVDCKNKRTNEITTIYIELGGLF